MGKYKGFKNRLEKFFSSDEGQRVFNFAYSFGASIVIVGALFKLLHLPGANIMLSVGMGTEAFIFALSAFDKPARNYHWEEVFPVLESRDPDDRPDLEGISEKMKNNPIGTVYVAGSANPQPMTAGQAAAQNYGPTPSATGSAPVNAPVNTPEVNQATDQYVQQINAMSSQLDQLRQITSALTNAQSQLLQSYTTISENSGSLGSNSANYVQQMESLNRNIMGLNTIYEIQLKSVSAQLDTIDKVNTGLSNVRNMYDSSAMDGFKIRQETEKMTENLANLNKIYERMISAMTSNMQNKL